MATRMCDVCGIRPAVGAIAETIRRDRTGPGDPNCPQGSFLYLEPTGVGRRPSNPGHP